MASAQRGLVLVGAEEFFTGFYFCVFLRILRANQEIYSRREQTCRRASVKICDEGSIRLIQPGGVAHKIIQHAGDFGWLDRQIFSRAGGQQRPGGIADFPLRLE